MRLPTGEQGHSSAASPPSGLPWEPPPARPCMDPASRQAQLPRPDSSLVPLRPPGDRWRLWPKTQHCSAPLPRSSGAQSLGARAPRCTGGLMPLREGASSSETQGPGACATPASCQEATVMPRRDGSTCGLWQPWACPLPCPPALSGRPYLRLSPSRPLVGSVCPQGSRTGACLLLLRLRLLLLLDLPQPRRRPAPGLSRQS